MGDNQVTIKAEEANDTTQALSGRRLSKTQGQILECLSPTSTSSPANKIRKLTTRRASTDRYKRILPYHCLVKILKPSFRILVRICLPLW